MSPVKSVLRKAFLFLIVVLISVWVAASLGWVFLPQILQRVLPKGVPQEAGLSISIQEARWGRGELLLTGVTVVDAKASEKEPFLSLGEVRVAFRLGRILFAREVGRVDVRQPKLVLAQRPSGAWNIQEILGRFKKRAPAAPPFSIAKLSVSSGHLVIETADRRRQEGGFEFEGSLGTRPDAAGPMGTARLAFEALGLEKPRVQARQIVLEVPIEGFSEEAWVRAGRLTVAALTGAQPSIAAASLEAEISLTQTDADLRRIRFAFWKGQGEGELHLKLVSGEYDLILELDKMDLGPLSEMLAQEGFAASGSASGRIVLHGGPAGFPHITASLNGAALRGVLKPHLVEKLMAQAGGKADQKLLKKLFSKEAGFQFTESRLECFTEADDYTVLLDFSGPSGKLSFTIHVDQSLIQLLLDNLAGLKA